MQLRAADTSFGHTSNRQQLQQLTQYAGGFPTHFPIVFLPAQTARYGIMARSGT
jgi:hypothetical protein